MKPVFSVPLLFLSLLAAGAVAGAADPALMAKERQRAELYAQRSDEARAKPPRALNEREKQAQALVDQAGKILAAAETEAEHDRAFTLYREACAVAPDYDPAWSGLGNAYLIRGLRLSENETASAVRQLELFAQGKSACTRAQELDPQSPAANCCLANLLFAEGGVKGIWASAWVLPEVFKLTDRVAEVDPYYDDGAVFRTFGVVFVTVPLWISKSFGYDPEQMLPYLDQSIAREPNRFVNYTVRAQVKEKIEQPVAALQDLDYILAHDPASPADFELENRTQQREARRRWKELTGKDYPERNP